MIQACLHTIPEMLKILRFQRVRQAPHMLQKSLLANVVLSIVGSPASRHSVSARLAPVPAAQRQAESICPDRSSASQAQWKAAVFIQTFMVSHSHFLSQDSKELTAFSTIVCVICLKTNLWYDHELQNVMGQKMQTHIILPPTQLEFLSFLLQQLWRRGMTDALFLFLFFLCSIEKQYRERQELYLDQQPHHHLQERMLLLFNVLEVNIKHNSHNVQIC